MAEPTPTPPPRQPHVMIAEARFYEELAEELAKGAVAALQAAGATCERFAVPGCLELPALVKFAVRSPDYSRHHRRFDGFVALGCVIRGETSHYDIVCNETARGLQSLALEHSLALGFGIITCENMEQARARALVSEQNKGGDAARACLRMIELKHNFFLPP
jgi:6,7-dimethyl-8-ribityllumazine synthase